MSGYVRIHRTLCGHPAFRNDAEAMAFAWLVARAQWKPTRVRYKERAITLARGQLAISIRDFAHAMDRDKAWVERLLKRLKSETMVETLHETGVTVITICNYAQYQADPVLCGTPAETPHDTRARQGQDTEQGKGKREKGNLARKRAEPVELPEWLPGEQWADFTAMRKKMRNAPFEAGAQKRLIARLDTLRGEGHCPAKLLDKAIERGWRTVFPDEDTKGSVKTQTVAERIENLRGAIGFFERMNRPDDAEDCRRRLAALEKPPDPEMAAKAGSLIGRVAKARAA